MNEHDDIGAKAGEIWVLQNGFKATIDSTNGRPPHIIIGRISTKLGDLAWSWTAEGHSNPNTPPGRRGFDSAALVRRYDWRAELAPIWAVLNPKYRWLAWSGAWDAWTFVDRPTRRHAGWDPNGVFEPLRALILPIPDCPWHETLTERPD
jgi:hypothetical protein